MSVCAYVRMYMNNNYPITINYEINYTFRTSLICQEASIRSFNSSVILQVQLFDNKEEVLKGLIKWRMYLKFNK